MKTIIKIIVGILVISSMAFGKLEKMPDFKENYVKERTGNQEL